MKKYIFSLVLFSALGACKDEPELIPAYLRLEPFVINEPGGAAWQKITDGWLYVNGEFLGAYTLPATVPILAEGQSEVILFPGVKENGITFTPNIYPFLKRYDVNAVLTPPGTLTIAPTTAYDPAAIFPYEGRGDFDGGSTLQFENRDTDSATGFSLTTDDAFAGKSILMEVDTAHPLIDIASEKVKLPTSAAQPVWLELHYKTDMPFVLNLLSTTGASSEIVQNVFLFNTSENWNKTYINLTEFLVASQQDDHRLLFRVGLPRNDAGNYSQNTGSVRLDNIRLVHF